MMFYQRELDFFLAILQKYRLQTVQFPLSAAPENPLDFGLRASLGLQAEYDELFGSVLQQLQPNALCRLTDEFRCSYVLLRLPDAPEPTVLVVGPFTNAEVDRQQLAEDAEQLGLPGRDHRQLERYYERVPIIEDDRLLFAVFHTFADQIWGRGSAYEIVDLNRQLPSALPPAETEPNAHAEFLMKMQATEMRYAYENELMRTVSQGLIHRANQMLSGFSQLSLEQRMVDTLRNTKNYCIICNTLLRKAAEQGGVHPIYLDTMSSDFARQIEALRSVPKAHELMSEMARKYCQLVKKHTAKAYSPLVQRVITRVDYDLAGDLSLNTLAQSLNINASYLSTLFKKETGSTLTSYVAKKRIEQAAYLLLSTRQPISAIAQSCGFQDDNYFTKVFKKYARTTPKQFRHMGERFQAAAPARD